MTSECFSAALQCLQEARYETAEGRFRGSHCAFLGLHWNPRGNNTRRADPLLWRATLLRGDRPCFVSLISAHCHNGSRMKRALRARPSRISISLYGQSSVQRSRESRECFHVLRFAPEIVRHGPHPTTSGRAQDGQGRLPQYTRSF